MDAVLKSFKVIKNNETLSYFELFKRGSVYEVRNAREVIYTGIKAEKEYDSCLEVNKEVASLIDAEVIIIK